MKKIYRLEDLIGKGIKLGNEYLTEEELEKSKEYVIVGAGILQRGYCNRELSYPGGYDEWFDSIEECEEYISSMERLGYGNTISGPYPLFKNFKR